MKSNSLRVARNPAADRHPFREARWGFVFLLVVCAVARYQGHAADVLVERDVAVPMSDGTILRANVFRPSEGGPFPVLVSRTPYGKAANVDEQLVKSGFIVGTQDARGRFASDGEFESFIRFETHDGTDGRDTVEWAARVATSSLSAASGTRN